VPVLVDGDLTLFDSTVILEYLEDAYPEPPLYPADARTRAACRMLELYADEILLADIRRLMHRSEPPAADPNRRAQQEESAREAEVALSRHWSELERRLGDRVWFGGTFSVADIALFMSVLFAQRLHGPKLDGFPALAEWYARTAARPSVASVASDVAEADRTLSPDLATWAASS
jgi:glutathione S-transferase